MISEDLLKRMNKLITECNNLYTELEENNLLNEQEVLNWLDDLNTISVQY